MKFLLGLVAALGLAIGGGAAVTEAHPGPGVPGHDPVPAINDFDGSVIGDWQHCALHVGVFYGEDGQRAMVIGMTDNGVFVYRVDYAPALLKNRDSQVCTIDLLEKLEAAMIPGGEGIDGLDRSEAIASLQEVIDLMNDRLAANNGVAGDWYAIRYGDVANGTVHWLNPGFSHEAGLMRGGWLPAVIPEFPAPAEFDFDEFWESLELL